MKYKYNKYIIQSIRVEKKGGNIILLKKPHYQLVVNQSAYDIFNVLEKYDDTEQIIEEIKNKYPKTESSDITNDVIEIMKNYELFGIIEIIDDLKRENSILYSTTGDTNYKFVSKFINDMIVDSSATKYYLVGNKDYYSPVSMRLRTMQNKEFGVYCQKDDIILAYVCMSYDNISISHVIQIKSLIFAPKMSIDEVEMYLSGMIDHCLKCIDNIASVSKFRISLCDCNENQPFISLMENCGFEKECVLKDETIKGDLIYLTKFVK